MRNLILVFGLILLTSCSEEYVAERSIEQLNKQILKQNAVLSDLTSQAVVASASLESINNLIANKIDDLPEDNKKYLILLEVKQSRTMGVLDTDNYFKDEMNKLKIPLEVSKGFYNSHNVGERLKDEFRVGSFILNGTMSSWRMTIKEKYVVPNI
jgi:K+ transporter